MCTFSFCHVRARGWRVFVHPWRGSGWCRRLVRRVGCLKEDPVLWSRVPHASSPRAQTVKTLLKHSCQVLQGAIGAGQLGKCCWPLAAARGARCLASCSGQDLDHRGVFAACGPAWRIVPRRRAASPLQARSAFPAAFLYHMEHQLTGSGGLQRQRRLTTLAHSLQASLAAGAPLSGANGASQLMHPAHMIQVRTRHLLAQGLGRSTIGAEDGSLPLP